MADLEKPKNQDIRVQSLPGGVSWSGQTPNTIWAGVSELLEEGSGYRIAIVIRNSTYLLECLGHKLEEPASGDAIELSREIISQFQNYSAKYDEKFIGAGLPESLVLKCPGLCSQLWFKLDIVPLVLRHVARARTAHDRGEVATFRGWERKALDEQADSMARKSFGIGHVIHSQISHDNLVEVDSNFRARLAEKEDYERTVEPTSWAIAQKYARELREEKVKVAFFSMTFHGKPDVHTRHALMRFSHCMGVDFRWYVAKPRPGIISIVQKMRDILEGLDKSLGYLSFDEELEILELDGFNKNMNPADISFYGQQFNSLCKTLNAPSIQYPEEQYILHLAQFRPSDETMIILQAYHMFCCQSMKESPTASIPKLLICRHGPPKGHESAVLYEKVMRHINTTIQDISHLIYVMELGGPDQLWNVLLSHAKVVVQLSIPEGIPEFLLCAIQKQKPLITIKAASSYSFLENNPTTWLVDKVACNSISQLFRQLNDPKLSSQMTLPLRHSLPDQYTTVGNATAWFYLASKLSKGESIEPEGRDLYQLAQSAASRE
ncbi:hypothetical protein KXV25_000303 [Aspergillus fumigatus]|nr:hypothetical protein KXV90_008211 [Aspergillus fumigatus]KAH2988028.1 hypothetical protein KXV25_000303 [Aspergillus fumigatus]